MSSIPDSVRIKVERGNKHISDLEAAINEFFGRRPYKVVAYIDGDKRPTYCLQHIETVDPSILAIALSDHSKPANDGHLKTGQRE